MTEHLQLNEYEIYFTNKTQQCFDIQEIESLDSIIHSSGLDQIKLIAFRFYPINNIMRTITFVNVNNNDKFLTIFNSSTLENCEVTDRNIRVNMFIHTLRILDKTLNLNDAFVKYVVSPFISDNQI